MPLCRRRSCSATTAALSTGSIGVLITASASDQLASQPSCRRAMRTTIGGQFVVSTTQQGLDAFRGGGPKLSADPSFLAAKKQSGMGAETTGFVYANVKDTLPLLALAGVKLPAGLPSLGTFMGYGGTTADESTFTAVLGVG